jgi:signal transduction histidine kinase
MCSTCAYGQLAKTDTIAQQVPASHARAELYLLMSSKNAKNDPDKAREYLKKAKEEAGEDPYLNAKSAFYEAQILAQTDVQGAVQAFLNADNLLTPFHSKEALFLRARSLSNYLRLISQKGDHTTSFSFLTQKVIPLAKAMKDTVYLAEKYGTVAKILMEQSQYQKADNYYRQALELLKDRRKDGPLVLSIKIGSCQNFLRLKKLTKAKLLLDEIRDYIPRGTLLEARFRLNEGMYLSETYAYKPALEKFKTAKALAAKLDNNSLVKAITYYQMNLLKIMKNHEQSQNIAFNTFNKLPLNASNKILIYRHNADIYFQQKKYDSAFYYLKKVNFLMDSIYESKLKNEISALEIKFRSDENKMKITELKAAQLNAQIEVDRGRFYIGLFALTTLFLGTLAVLLSMYLSKTKKEQVQREQVNTARALLRGQDEERKRVARDLHDDLGGTLTVLKMNLFNAINESSTISQKQSLNEVIGQLDDSVAKVRQIANNMMPEMLLKLGLEAAIKDLCTYYSSDDLHINLDYMDVSESLQEQEKLTIYRIIQELLTNTVKHARARQVLIQCSQMEQTVFLTYEDDGIGLQQKDKSGSQGLGLENIKARIGYLKGHFEVVSEPACKGTIFNIELNVSNEISNRHS